MSQSGDLHFPSDVLPGIDIPGIGQVLGIHSATGKRAPELWPLGHIVGLCDGLNGKSTYQSDDEYGSIEVHGEGFNKYKNKFAVAPCESMVGY